MLSNKELLIAGAGIGASFLLSSENRMRNTLIAVAVAGGGIYLGRTIADDRPQQLPTIRLDEPIPEQTYSPPTSAPPIPVGVDSSSNPIVVTPNTGSSFGDIINRIAEAFTPTPVIESTAITITPLPAPTPAPTPVPSPTPSPSPMPAPLPEPIVPRNPYAPSYTSTY